MASVSLGFDAGVTINDGIGGVRKRDRGGARESERERLKEARRCNGGYFKICT